LGRLPDRLAERGRAGAVPRQRDRWLHHAGASTVNDRSCLDHRTSIGAGQPLLAGSNCPETWGSEGWAGARRVPVEIYTQRFTALGDNFNFDFWRVADADLDAAGVPEFEPIGSFQTYGYTSDFTAEILCGTSVYRNFAHIIPTTSPAVPGVPAGRSGSRCASTRSRSSCRR